MAQTTYQRIIKIAYQLFAKNGYDGTSMSLITRKAKISKGALYHYFDSKEKLLLAVFEEMLIKPAMKGMFDPEILTPENYKDFVSQMGLQFLRTISHDSTHRKFSLQMMGTMLKLPNLFDYFMPVMNKMLERLNGLLDKGIEFGLLSPKMDRELMAQKIFVYLDMFELYVSLDIPFRLEDLWTEMISSLFNKKGATC